MKKILLFLASTALLSACSGSPRTVEDFNFDWRFALGENPERATTSFDDSGWRELHLPHDWSIEGEFSRDNPSTPGGGALPGGIGWYRKTFETPSLTEGGRAFLEFDGVFMNSTVWVNGVEMGTRPYGYSSFSYDITDALNPVGEANTVAVRCDNADQPNSRWYAGCGIYRDVRLVTVSDAFVKYHGVYVTTGSLSRDEAGIRIEIDVQGHPDEVEVTILDAGGREIEDEDAEYAGGKWVAECDMDRPHLWDIDDTYRYTAVVSVKDAAGRITDRYSQKFGIRSTEWDPDRGFRLNGRPVKLLGVCLHHDQGCLGTAVHRRALERELGILKEMGCNAIRTSHNPPAPVLLDLCDEMGFLVIDEALDMWRKRKTTYDYSRFFDEWHERDVQDFVIRDRNHPCIIAWSIGNEILEQWNSNEDDIRNLSAEQANLLMNFMSSLPQYEAGDDNPNIVLTRHLAALVRELDSRPVTAGCNETRPTNNLLRSGAIDLYGFNYHVYDYDNVRQWYPGKVLYGSETASSLESRGYYPQPSTDRQKQPGEWWMTYETPHHQCSAYDALCAPWAEYHEQAWVAVRDRDYMAGTFVWTGFDYLGEPTPYSWPSRSSYFGIVDLAGFPKDVYWMYQSEWTDRTVLHLFPHWNWSEGDKVDLWCWYSNADEVELFLNGKSLGKSHKEGEQLRAQWLQVPWEPGTVEAVSYRDGKEVARTSRETSGEGVAVKLEADRSSITSDGYDLSYVTVSVVDAQGREVPTASMMLNFKVEGCGELFGVDNGNAADTLCLKGSRKALFNGKALGVVRSVKGAAGTATLTVSSEDGSLQGASIEIKCKKGRSRSYVTQVTGAKD